MKRKHLLLLLVVASTWSACDPDCDTPVKYPLPKPELYNGTETLRFLHNNTDTQVYVGQGARRQWIKLPAADETQCPESYEEVEYIFACTSNNNVIRIKHSTFLIAQGLNSKQLYFNNIFAGQTLVPKDDIIREMIINGIKYTYLKYRCPSIDTPYYFLCSEYAGSPDFIVKIKYPGDTLTLIK